jgi:hypothetical protein
VSVLSSVLHSRTRGMPTDYLRQRPSTGASKDCSSTSCWCIPEYQGSRVRGSEDTQTGRYSNHASFVGHQCSPSSCSAGEGSSPPLTRFMTARMRLAADPARPRLACGIALHPVRCIIWLLPSCASAHPLRGIRQWPMVSITSRVNRCGGGSRTEGVVDSLAAR